MESTSYSLLDRLRHNAQPDDWRKLVELYEPWIHDWLCRQGLQEHDAADVTQEVLAVVVQELPSFEYDRQRGRFRGWLRTITVNRLRAFWKSRRRQPVSSDDSNYEEILQQLADPSSDLSRQWDEEHDLYLVQRTLERIRPEFRSSTWDVFDAHTMQGKPADEVAQHFGITRNAVYIAQSRVLARLREELQGLCD